MQKRSFFQKLTGSYPMDEEEEVPVVITKQQGIRGPKVSIPTPIPAVEEEEGQLTVDVYQTPDAIIIEAMVAGVNPDDIDVSITREMVTIRGHRKDSRTTAGDDFFYRELYWGAFSRTIVLPQEIEPEESGAEESHGLLRITLPKINKEKIAKLRVKST